MANLSHVRATCALVKDGDVLLISAGPLKPNCPACAWPTVADYIRHVLDLDSWPESWCDDAEDALRVALAEIERLSGS